jgi:hypothetical protein
MTGAGVDWLARAACVGADPEIFFPTAEDGPVLAAQERLAKTVCTGCPVRSACLAWALHALPDGIAGGLTPKERRAFRANPGVAA